MGPNPLPWINVTATLAELKRCSLPPPLLHPAGYATVDRAEQLTAPTPTLGKLSGGQTPLLGNAKVSARRMVWAGGWLALLVFGMQGLLVAECALLRGHRLLWPAMLALEWPAGHQTLLC